MSRVIATRCDLCGVKVAWTQAAEVLYGPAAQPNVRTRVDLCAACMEKLREFLRARPRA